jgi:small conductance mechanosensitive channel
MGWISNLINGLKRMIQGDFSALDATAMETIGSGLVGLVLLIAAYFVAKLVSRSVSGAICKRIDETLGKFLGRLCFYSVLITALLSILARFGVPVAAAMAVLTAAGFAIGLAFQGTLSNFAAGVLLLVFRPFKVGDMVVAGGVTGMVNEIDLFTTTFDTPDNRRMIIPNSAIASGTIENMTYHVHRRVDVTVGVAFSASLDQTRAALTAAANAMSDLMISGDSRGFQVVLNQLGTNSVDWTIRFWATTENFADAKERLTYEIKLHLDRAGIEIPFPQMQLHYSPNSSASLAPETSESSATHPVRPRMRRAGREAA